MDLALRTGPARREKLRTKEKSAFLWLRAKIIMPVISKPSLSPKVGDVQK